MGDSVPKREGIAMGAFLLIRKPKNVEVEEIEGTYRDSIAVFHKKGLPLNERIVTNDFVIYVFHKHKFQVDNTLLLDDGEFIISTGTCIYDRKIGCDALRKLYRDFSEKGEFLSNVFGQYCLIVSKEGSLYLLNDYTGLYHVYSNHSRSVISSSFLAVFLQETFFKTLLFFICHHQLDIVVSIISIHVC